MSTTPDITDGSDDAIILVDCGCLSQCVIALLLFVAANVYTYETSGFFQREREYTEQVSAVADSHQCPGDFCRRFAFCACR